VGLLDPDRFSVVPDRNRDPLLGEVLRFVSGGGLVGLRRANPRARDFLR
jgi:hypothetical protein